MVGMEIMESGPTQQDKFVQFVQFVIIAFIVIKYTSDLQFGSVLNGQGH